MPEPAGPRLDGLPRDRSRASRATPSISWSSSISACRRDDPLPDPHGAGRADAGGNAVDRPPARAATRAWLLVQILRHLGLPARFVSGYLIQLKPDIDVARRPVRHRRTISPTCTPGPKSICPAPAGSGSTRPPACCAAKAICRSRRRRTTARPRRSPARSSRPRSTFAFDMSVTRIAEKPRVTLPFSDEAWSGARCARREGRRRSGRAGRAPHHGRRADLRVDRRLRVGGMEHRRARPDQARARRRTDPPPARPLRAGRPAALRPGQMVSGRAAAALGVLAALAQGRRADLAQRRADRATRGRPDLRRADDARRFTEVLAARLGIAAEHASAGVRGSRRPDAEGGRAARRTSIRAIRRSTIRRARAHHARVRAPSRSAGRLRAAGAALDRAGQARLDQRSLADCGAAGCSWCRAIRRSASGCRSIRCRMSTPREYPHVVAGRSVRARAGRCPDRSRVDDGRIGSITAARPGADDGAAAEPVPR